ncbi:MAG: VOC family protein [Gammaproteobacteria bacterium]
MREHEKINYVEFPCGDFAATKAFFGAAFGWIFTDYGADYAAFSGAGLDGGMYRAPPADDDNNAAKNGGMLVVLYSGDLESTEEKIRRHGGKIVRETFSFPGGRRFHFVEPSGNEFAVWSDK